jgi:hypothetical protein
VGLAPVEFAEPTFGPMEIYARDDRCACCPNRSDLPVCLVPPKKADSAALRSLRVRLSSTRSVNPTVSLGKEAARSHLDLGSVNSVADVNPLRSGEQGVQR